MVALLREEGYRALRAWDVREAVKIARDRKPDLLLLDLSLPYREGLPQLLELRAHAETQDAPIVVVSGNACSSLRASASSLPSASPSQSISTA